MVFTSTNGSGQRVQGEGTSLLRIDHSQCITCTVNQQPLMSERFVGRPRGFDQNGQFIPSWSMRTHKEGSFLFNRLTGIRKCPPGLSWQSLRTRSRSGLCDAVPDVGAHNRMRSDLGWLTECHGRPNLQNSQRLTQAPTISCDNFTMVTHERHPYGSYNTTC